MAGTIGTSGTAVSLMTPRITNTITAFLPITNTSFLSFILLPLSFKTYQVSRLESPGYEGHSLSMLRRVAEVLHAKMRLAFEPAETKKSMRVAERPARYGIKRLAKRRESGRKRS